MTPYYQDDLVTLHHGDARALPLPDESVDLIVTSPPYWSLRSYQDAGEHYDGQIGSEATPREFIDNLIACTREWMRVLKPSGSIFVNLGDKYAGGGQGGNVGGNLGKARGGDPHLNRTNPAVARPVPSGMRAKSLMLLPERYRIAAVDELGLIARAVIVWSKPNGLPESVTDRVRRSHEDWVHLTKAPRYFAAVDEIREPHAPDSLRASKLGATSMNARNTSIDGGATAQAGPNPLGKLPGSVWEIATQPLKVPAELGVDHFAAFPMEWPRRLILGWSPREVCTVCGEGRRPVTERVTGLSLDGRKRPAQDSAANWSETQCGDNQWGGDRTFARGVGARITGYACACPDTSAPSTPGVVLDPFSGTGTTSLVAAMHGRRGIGVDASEDYCRLAEWRVNDPKQRERAGRAAGTKPPTAKRGAKVMGTAKPQTDLFDLPA